MAARMDPSPSQGPASPPAPPSRRLALLAFAVGLLLYLPSLGSGFYLDDYILLTLVDQGSPFQSSPWDLFSFTRGDLEVNAAMRAFGALPWWSAPDLQLAFFRPLSSALFRLDHALFGDAAWLYHLHNLAWWGALLAGVWRLYRRILPGTLAVLALGLFALDESHALPVIWVANRNALVAVVPVLWGFLAHLRWRQDGWRPGAPLALLGYALGLAGGEAAVSMLAFPLAFELVAGTGGVRRRAAALAPIAAVVAAYAVVYKVGGYGAHGSGLYLHPLDSFGAWATAMPARLLTLLAGALATLSADLWLVAPELRTVLVVVGAVAVLSFTSRLRGVLADATPERRQTIGWLALGAVGSLLPGTATFPSDRMALSASVGVLALVSLVLARAWALRDEEGRRPLRAWAAAGWVGLLHVVLPPLVVLGVQSAMAEGSAQARAIAAASAPGLGPLAEEDVIVVAPGDYVIGVDLPHVWRQMGYPLARRWQVLTLAPLDLEVSRPDDRTLVLQVVDGQMMTALFEQVFRGGDTPPLRVGDRALAGQLTATIEAAGEEGPTRVSFDFGGPLEEGGLLLVAWDGERLAPWTPPPVGGAASLPWKPGPAIGR